MTLMYNEIFKSPLDLKKRFMIKNTKKEDLKAELKFYFDLIFINY